MKNQVQLITYVDRLSGGGIADLHELLRGPLSAVFGGVHLLPFFYPYDGADAGFDPIDHRAVDPRLGTWQDVRALGQELEIVADLIVNHVSIESDQFRDFSRHGNSSRFAGLFLSLARVFPQGALESDLLRIYRPRPGLPFTSVTLQNGEKHLLWTTFTPQQVDIDVCDPTGDSYLKEIVATFRANSIKTIRLDAAGYAIKRAGSSCFMTAETYRFISELSSHARKSGIEVLAEIHGHYLQQTKVAQHVDWVYDFALPPLVLHTLFEASADALKAWLRISPRNCLTVLDTHDGIGVIDVGADPSNGALGLLGPEAISRLVETIHANSEGASRRATGAAASNLDLYQVNCTFFEALGRKEINYLMARAIQFFCPGIPQVYYVGLLAGLNDMELLGRSGIGRDINRHFYTQTEVEDALEAPVVRDLLDLIRFRNRHPAFAGIFSLAETPAQQLQLEWHNDCEWASLLIDLEKQTVVIRCTEDGRQAQANLFSHCCRSS